MRRPATRPRAGRGGSSWRRSCAGSPPADARKFARHKGSAGNLSGLAGQFRSGAGSIWARNAVNRCGISSGESINSYHFSEVADACYLLRWKDTPRCSAQIFCMNQAMLERYLAQAEEHVAHWREHAARQMRIVAELEAKGQDATGACGLLDVFRVARESLEGDLGEIKKALLALDKVPTETAPACSQTITDSRSPPACFADRPGCRRTA